MPRNLSAAFDAVVFLIVMAVLVGIAFIYNVFLGLSGVILWLAMAVFAYDRCRDRKQKIERYLKNVLGDLPATMAYAVDKLPQAVFVLTDEKRLAWSNDTLFAYVGLKVEPGTAVENFWPEIVTDKVWGTEGEYIFSAEDKFYLAKYRPITVQDEKSEKSKRKKNSKAKEKSPAKEDAEKKYFMAYYVADITEMEKLRREYQSARAVLAYIQIDNIDEVFQGLSESERTSLLFAVNQAIDEWGRGLEIYVRRVTDELYVACMERRQLDKAMAENFEILDRVRQIKSVNKIPVTLSIGAAVAANETVEELGQKAHEQLDHALGRGGDQTVVFVDGKKQYFGGKATAVEKHTRVRARVLAHALKDLMENADEVIVMGHHNEDFDALGAAMGIAKMADVAGRPTHIVLSSINDGIDKLIDLLREKPEYREKYGSLFITEKEASSFITEKSLLVVVDTHIPHLVAAPSLLSAIGSVVVIDHHRRSEKRIEKPILDYSEPSASSTSEMVAELMMYFSDGFNVSGITATALFAGILVDTKNFTVQTGTRTFEAAAYLRRAGADPVVVKNLFRTDYESNITIAKIKAASHFYSGGLIVATGPVAGGNMQVLAAQAADSLLKVDAARMSIVIFQLKEDTVGISARSTGDLNVQVIMEKFGGGGHQNVAGAQINGANIKDIEEKVIAACKEYIAENA